MNIASLSTEQSPPISFPFSFFALAPLFLPLAAVMLALDEGNPFAETHSPALLAATHCITLGFMAAVMFGAVQQILPVLVGSKMPAARLVARFTLPALFAGTLALCGGFMRGQPLWFNLAWILLGPALLTFTGASLISLARAPANNATRSAILLAVIALAIAGSIGGLLAHGFATGAALPYPEWLVAHAGFSLGGWVMLLIAGVSYQVVPMFQLTPNYPKWLTAALAPALFVLLLAGFLPLLFGTAARPLTLAAESLYWLLAVIFAGVTLNLQSRRRRRVPDATLSFFRLGMVSLICAALFAFAATLCPAAHTAFRTLSALAFLLGFAMSVVNGMLYKIIPFLVWFHLFRGGMKSGIPNMKQIIPEPWMWWHYRLQWATLLAAAGAPFLDRAAWLVAAGLSLQGFLLGAGVFKSIAVYRKHVRQINRAQA